MVGPENKYYFFHPMSDLWSVDGVLRGKIMVCLPIVPSRPTGLANIRIYVVKGKVFERSLV